VVGDGFCGRKEKEGRKTFKCTFMSQQKKDSHLKIISVSGRDWSVVQLQKVASW
jgi:hypothetical protein